MTEIKLPPECVNVGIGQWRVCKSPVGLRAILGSCLGVVIYDPTTRIGGMAHILLPDSRGSAEHPGRYADTAVPALLGEIHKSRGGIRGGLVAKLAGGAKMFDTQGVMAIGEANHKAVLTQLEKLRIPILSNDIGGEVGRNVTFDTSNGRFYVKRPGGVLYEVL
jgi:chemotaxis protein CheD